jgi:short/branched chain acyl-CoA dehydrogenase
MDEKELLDPSILKGLFDQGLMGIETEAKYEGAESSFTAAILVVEELAKVDPAVSVVCGTLQSLFSHRLSKCQRNIP